MKVWNIEEFDGITKFDCDIDVIKLKEISDKIRSKAEVFIDTDEEERKKYSKEAFDGWRIYRVEESDDFFDYIESIKNEFNIKGKFHHTGWLSYWYFQKPNYSLPVHQDYLTECSLNFNVGDNPSPVTVNDKDVTYNCALLNTQEFHTCKNENSERNLFKISIYSDTYESYLKKFRNRFDQ
jgi:hypothetical protein